MVFGHRPTELGGWDANPVADDVRRQLAEIFAAKRELDPDLVVLTGLRLGAEQLGAEAAIDAGVPFVAVLAYPDQDRPWSADTASHFRRPARPRPRRHPARAEGAGDRQKAGAALARRDAWLARRGRGGARVGRQGPELSRLARSLEDHLGEDVWILEPRCRRESGSDVDTGGTFTDVVGDDGRIAKVPSTRADPGGVPSVAASPSSARRRPCRPQALAHGTTVATNALLERRGARVALVTNDGLADVSRSPARTGRRCTTIWVDRPAPLVPATCGSR